MTGDGLGWPGAWRLARRDLNPALRGLRLLFICLFLGVATLAAIGSLTAAIRTELAARGQELLGGDIEAAISQRTATTAELAQLRRLGPVSTTIRMRAMAQTAMAQTAGPQPAGTPGSDAPAAVLSELKAVDAAYPLYGQLTLADGRVAAAPIGNRVLIGQSLADRLAVAVGDPLRFGGATLRVAAIIGNEPDRVGEGFTLGPVAITSIDAIRATGLMQPGSLYTVKYRLRLRPGIDTAATANALSARLSAAGWQVKDQGRAAPGTSRFIDNMGQFLSLIGLAALVIAGIGVGNGVASYLTAKRGGIAALKSLGAGADDITRIYALQIACVGALAIGTGLVTGALASPALTLLMGSLLPVAPGFALHPAALGTAAAYGALIAVIFTVPALANARRTPAAALFRAAVGRSAGIDRRSLAIVAGAALAVVAIAVGTAAQPTFAAGVLGGVAGALLLLLAISLGVRAVARRLPRSRRPLLRLAIASLYRPGAQTPALVVALGLALTLFVTLAAIQTSLAAEIARTVPARAPDSFVLDIPSTDTGRFRAIAATAAPGATVQLVPALRGTITAYGAQRVADLAELPKGAWFLNGERGVTYAAALPPGSDLVAGRWWPADYAGPPLVSIDAEAAGVLGVGVGDSLTVSVLGREIRARIASLRKVNWDTMGFNYILVFSPNTLANAPHSFAATIALPGTKSARAATGAGLQRQLLRAFPGISIVPVGDILGQVTALLGQMSAAILAAASITILAGIAVLIGAIAASRQSRSYDSVIMKTLGATRGQVLAAQALEYALLAAVLALVALALGGGAAWFVITRLFDFAWAPDWRVVTATLAGGAVLTLGIGLAGSLPLLGLRPAKALREL